MAFILPSYTTDQETTFADTYWIPVVFKVDRWGRRAEIVFHGFVSAAARNRARPVGAYALRIGPDKFADYFAPGLNWVARAYQAALDIPVDGTGQSFFAAASRDDTLP
jgi:hypothetical protein